jgi:DnaK suppressor protein
LAIETSPDELDQIQHAGDRDMAIDNLERDSSQPAEVRSRLRRVNAGAFEFCVGCEEKINPKRLAAVRWASFCIVCQEALDREKRPGAISIHRSSWAPEQRSGFCSRAAVEVRNQRCSAV